MKRLLLVLLALGSAAWIGLTGLLPSKWLASVSLDDATLTLHQPAWPPLFQARRLSLQPLLAPTPPFLGLARVRLDQAVLTLPPPAPPSARPTPFRLPILPFEVESFACTQCRVQAPSPMGPVHIHGDMELRFPTRRRLELTALLDLALPMELTLSSLALRGSGEGAGLKLHTLAFGAWDGEITVENAHLDLETMQGAATLTLEDLDMARLLRPFALPGLQVEGRLRGEGHIVVDAEGWRIPPTRLAGQGPGVIRYTQPGWEQSAQAAGVPEILPRILENLHTTALELTLERPRSSEVHLQARITGSNPDLLEGHPVVLNLDLSGPLDEILRQGLEARQQLSNPVEKR